MSSPERRSTEQHARIVDIVRDWADREPERVCLTFHGLHGRTDSLTYGALSQEASAYGQLFLERGLRPGSPVVLLAPSVSDFVSAFLGAQQVGLVAIPAPSPEPIDSRARYRERLLDIIRRSRAQAVFNPAPEALTSELGPALAAAGVALLTPAALSSGAGVEAATAGGCSRIAYCQFTSGSGGRAKGVLLTHENVLANIRARRVGYDLGAGDVGVNWLPLSHDMGLVGYVLYPLATGMPCHIMSPHAFLADPRSWLALISRVRATMSGAPNFAYGLCVRRIVDTDLSGLELSNWRRASNGAEPVTLEVVEAFVRRFAPVGFKASAMLPAYGLAENTLTVASRRPGHGARFDVVSREALANAKRAVQPSEGESRLFIASAGQPLPGQQIAILDPGGFPLDEREVGEIAVRGESVMDRYLPGTEGEAAVRPDGWLLTGDLGYLADGELFIAGRKKDLIIRAGRNYYPQDMEDAVGCLPGVRIGRVVAFSVPGPEIEQVIVVAERRAGTVNNSAAVQAEIRQAVFAAVRFQPDDVVLVPAQTLPLTTSGKIMRPEARRLYLEGRYGAL
jgi:fatty-acyl-CoA synthase